MKRKLTIILTVLMLMILASGCNKITNNSNELDKVDISTYVETLNTEFSYGCSADRFVEYMKNWANQNELEIQTDNYGNVIFFVTGTEGYEDVIDTVICCDYNPSFFSNDITTISMCQYLLENSTTHGTFKVIFTNNNLNKHEGALNLSTEFFNEDSRIISLDYSYKTHASINTGNQFNSNLVVSTEKKSDNLLNTAYKIEITGIKTAVLDEHVKQQPNPIKILGELMAYFKMKSMEYQLADITYETAGGSFPLGAEFTILINGYSKTKFLVYMDSKIESFNKKYEDDFEGISYTYEEVELPTSVYNEDSTENIISLLYMITNGTSLDSNDDVYAISTIKGLEKDDFSFTLNLVSNTRSKESMSNLYEEINTVTTFVNAELNTEENFQFFNGIKDSELLAELNQSDIEYSKDELNTYDSVRFTSCTYLQNKNTNLDIVHIFVEADDSNDITGCLATYFINSNIVFTEDDETAE